MIQIKNTDGSVIVSVMPTENAVFHEELMQSDYVQLSWNSDNGRELPAGAYIEYEGEKYRLLDPYTPQQNDEAEYTYTPQFQSRVMNWGKQITPVYKYEDEGSTVKSREMDWTFTGSPADAMYIVKQAIKNETDEDWNVQLADELPATITISSQSASILSVLGSIASECNTEWWANKETNTLYLSKCIFGEPITLTTGENVGVPSVQSDSEGYYTRFFAFGSARNIPQSQVEGEANVNKRLTLDVKKYPFGYKDIREGLTQDEIFVKVLYFDDIYPSSKLTISDVRARLRYRLDNNGNRIQIGGTTDKPIYEQYAIWYFQIADFAFNEDMIIEGLNLSASFESGQLGGRDFELTYHDKAEKVKDANDVTEFQIKAGDYEIIIDETSGQIIPGVAYIIPQDGDSVILFNIEMPAEYTASAQMELEKAMNKAIAEQSEDSNSYSADSNPVDFYNAKTDLKMGMAVNFVHMGKTLQSRLMMVEKRIDLPCYQSFTVGNKVLKGNTQQLKEDVANANQNIDVIKAFNDLSASLSQAYANAQREMIEGFAAIKNLWQLRQDEKGNYYAYSQYDVLTGGGITAYTAGTAEVPSIFDGLPIDNDTIYWDESTGVRILKAKGGGGSGDFDASKMWDLLAASTNEQIAKSHLTTALGGYATESWVTSKGYALQTSLDAVSTKLNDFLEGSDTDNIINKWKELEAFLSGMTESDNLAQILSTKADKTYVDGELKKYVTLSTEQTISGLKHFTNGVTIGTSKHKLYEENGVIYLDGDLAVKGGVTAYAVSPSEISTVMDGVVVDGTTIVKEDGKLVAKNAGGGEAGYVEWANIKNKPSWISSTNPSYTKSESDGRYLQKSVYTATDILNKLKTVDGSGSGLDADLFDGFHRTEHISSGNATYFKILTLKVLESYVNAPTTFELSGRSSLSKSFVSISFSNAESLDPNIDHFNYFGDTIYARYLRLYKTSSGTWELWLKQREEGYDTFDLFNISVCPNVQLTINNQGSSTLPTSSTYKDISLAKVYADFFGNASSATKLQTPRTLWGRSFDGTQSISGNLDSVGTITGSSTLTLIGKTDIHFKRNNEDSNSVVLTIDAFKPFNAANNLIDLGASAAKWRNLYVGNEANVYNKLQVFASTSDTSHYAYLTTESSYAKLQSVGSIPLSFNPDGNNVGIGTTSPSERLHVAGNTKIGGEAHIDGSIITKNGIEIYHATPFIDFHFNNSTSDYTSRIWEDVSGRININYGLYIKNTGVGVGVSEPRDRLEVNGNIRFSQEHFSLNDKYGTPIFKRYGSSTKVTIVSGNNGSIYLRPNGVDNDEKQTSIATDGTLTTRGNILATGGITCYASDQRAKTIINKIDLSLQDIANSPTIRFKWNGWKIKDDGKTHIGGIAQYVERLLPEVVLDTDDFKNMDYATTAYIYSVCVARSLKKTDTEVERLKKRVSQLEEQLKKYENNLVN